MCQSFRGRPALRLWIYWKSLWASGKNMPSKVFTVGAQRPSSSNSQPAPESTSQWASNRPGATMCVCNVWLVSPLECWSYWLWWRHLLPLSLQCRCQCEGPSFVGTWEVLTKNSMVQQLRGLTKSVGLKLSVATCRHVKVLPVQTLFLPLPFCLIDDNKIIIIKCNS